MFLFGLGCGACYTTFTANHAIKVGRVATALYTWVESFSVVVASSNVCWGLLVNLGRVGRVFTTSVVYGCFV